MPDYAWIATVCGGFAGVWAFLRTGLVICAIRESKGSKSALKGARYRESIIRYT